MRNFKKYRIMLLIALLLCGMMVFSGCGTSDSSGENNLVNASYGDGMTTNFDIHPNRDGHAVMGEVCYQVIKNNMNL